MEGEGMVGRGKYELVTNFIGTHGLAVFLVIFYAFVIYPQSQEERGEWIKEITRVRMLVDPASKPLNSIQAEAISLIAIGAFQSSALQIYNMREENLRMIDRLNPTFFPSPGDSERVFSVFGGLFNFDINDKKDVAHKNYSEAFEKISAEIVNAQREMNEISNQALQMAKAENESISIQLERLRLEHASLKKIWLESLLALDPEWEKYFDGKISQAEMYPIRNFLNGVRELPHFREWSDSNRELIDSLRSVKAVDGFTLSSLIKSRLEAQMIGRISTAASPTSH